MRTRATAVTPLGAVARGLAAAAVGTLAMDLLLFARYRHGDGKSGFRKWEFVGIDPAVLPSGDGCAECLAGASPGWWFHLRRCAQCGHVGCCDSSPSQHARAHFAGTGHRYIQSYEPGEDWFWDFAEEDYAQGPVLAPPHHHPEEQAVPGPAHAVPADWVQHLHP